MLGTDSCGWCFPPLKQRKKKWWTRSQKPGHLSPCVTLLCWAQFLAGASSNASDCFRVLGVSPAWCCHFATSSLCSFWLSWIRAPTLCSAAYNSLSHWCHPSAHVDYMFHHFSSAPCPVAASQRNGKGWRVAADDRVHSAFANSFPAAHWLAWPKRTCLSSWYPPFRYRHWRGPLSAISSQGWTDLALSAFPCELGAPIP